MKIDRRVEASGIAAALNLSPDSIGRYAREGRIPFDTSPGGHRRFNLDEVRLALLPSSDPTPAGLFQVPTATGRRQHRRAVMTSGTVTEAPVSVGPSAALNDLLCPPNGSCVPSTPERKREGAARENELALESHLRALEQGDLISLGAVAIVGTTSSEVTGTNAAKSLGVASVTVETPSGWYIVLTQDCDIVRPPSLEPCLTIAPVLYVPDVEWLALRQGLGSYRRYWLDPDTVAPLDDEHAANIGPDLRPVVDIRYISSLDKTALAAHYEQRFPLRGRQKIAFQDWVGSRFARESFDDSVHDEILPVVAAKLVAVQRERAAKEGSASPTARVASSCSQWYVRNTDRYVEVMGRRDPELAKSNGLLKIVDGTLEWNERDLGIGAASISKDVNKRVSRTGYAARLHTQDFDQLSASEFETYALWMAQD